MTIAALRVAAMACVLSVAGCGANAVWTPYSGAQKFTPTIKSCVLFSETDVERIKEVGGAFVGKVTVYGRRAATGGKGALEAAREKAAREGGTHCIGLSAETPTTTRGVVFEAWPTAKATVPAAGADDALTLLVINVPETNWPKLPEPVRPQRPSAEFQW